MGDLYEVTFILNGTAVQEVQCRCILPCVFHKLPK